jgi:hypothetical protein
MICRAMEIQRQWRTPDQNRHAAYRVEDAVNALMALRSIGQRIFLP